jgi:hypothetical protein
MWLPALWELNSRRRTSKMTQIKTGWEWRPAEPCSLLENCGNDYCWRVHRMLCPVTVMHLETIVDVCIVITHCTRGLKICMLVFHFVNFYFSVIVFVTGNTTGSEQELWHNQTSNHQFDEISSYYNCAVSVSWCWRRRRRGSWPTV